LDVLSDLEEIQVCVGYKVNGKSASYLDVDAYGLEKVELIYQKVKGWKEDLSKVRSFEKLPTNAQNYVKMIEEAAGAPVKWIGVGPERDATIRR
jgi:adenylosuccinate synthase